MTVPYGKSSRPQTATAMLPARASGHPVIRPGSLLHPGVVVHRSRAHRHIGVDTANPRTSKADTALDVAVAEPSARLAYVSLVHHGHQRANTTERRPAAHGRAATASIRRALEDAVGLLANGVQSVLEYHYAVDVEQAHGLPTAHRQSPVIVDGRTLFEDVDYSEHGVPLIVRLDGRWAHSMREVQFRDRRRDNAAELADRPRLVVRDGRGRRHAVCRGPGGRGRPHPGGLRRAGASRCRACAPFR